MVLSPSIAEAGSKKPSLGGRALIQLTLLPFPLAVSSFLLARSPSSALLSPFLGEGSPTTIDRKKGTLILASTGGPG